MELEITTEHRRLLSKLHASGADIKQARAYAELIVKKNWFKMPWSRGKQYFHQSAYVTALIVSYARPFAQGRNGYTFPRRLVPYDDTEWTIHERLLEQRNKIYAHSDLEKWNIRPWKSGNFDTVIIGQPAHYISREDIDVFIPMTSNIMSAIALRYSEILQEYGSGTNIYF